MTTLLDALKTEEDIQEETDTIGGAYEPLDSDVYLMKIKLAFITYSKNKAMALNIHSEGENKTFLRSQFYMTSGTDKGCKNYYINKRTQEKHYLPGFNQASAISLLTVGKAISKLTTEKKTINLYDPAQGKEVPTEVDMIMDFIDKSIYMGVINQIVDKRAMDPDTGTYMPTGETRTENEVDKVFRAKDKLTVVEIKAEQTEPVFMDKWTEKWQGVVKDKTDKKAPKTGAPKRETGKQAPTDNLFN